MKICIRGVEYPVFEMANTVETKVDSNTLSTSYSDESWEKTVENLTSLILKELGLVMVVFTHHRNVFKKNAFGGASLQPFFSKYLGCEVDSDKNIICNDGCAFEGYELGYYYPTFTIKKEVWDSANLPCSYSKNIVKKL